MAVSTGLIVAKRGAYIALSALTALGLSDCGGSSSPSLVTPNVRASTAPPGSPVGAKPAGTFAHIVVVIQENRSFDNIFAASGGFPGANTLQQGLNSQGGEVALQPLGYELAYGPQHASKYLVQSWDGGLMDKFDLTPLEGKLRTLLRR